MTWSNDVPLLGAIYRLTLAITFTLVWRQQQQQLQQCEWGTCSGVAVVAIALRECIVAYPLLILATSHAICTIHEEDRYANAEVASRLLHCVQYTLACSIEQF